VADASVAAITDMSPEPRKGSPRRPHRGLGAGGDRSRRGWGAV